VARAPRASLRIDDVGVAGQRWDALCCVPMVDRVFGKVTCDCVVDSFGLAVWSVLGPQSLQNGVPTHALRMWGCLQARLTKEDIGSRLIFLAGTLGQATADVRSILFWMPAWPRWLAGCALLAVLTC
jgi:hypothetical protein